MGLDLTHKRHEMMLKAKKNSTIFCDYSLYFMSCNHDFFLSHEQSKKNLYDSMHLSIKNPYKRSSGLGMDRFDHSRRGSPLSEQPRVVGRSKIARMIVAAAQGTSARMMSLGKPDGSLLIRQKAAASPQGFYCRVLYITVLYNRMSRNAGTL